MAAALDDAAVVEDHDDVGVLDGRQAVRDDEHRAALHQLIHAALDDGLGARVDGRCRFIEDHDRRVGDRRAGDGDELALALREVRAVVGELRRIALGETRDEVVRAGELRRGDALFVRCVEFTITNVVHHRAGEEVDVLQDDAERAAKICLFDLADVDAVVEDLAVGNVVKTVDKVRDGRLARTRRADEGNLLTGLCVDGDIVQDFFIRLVAEVHVDKAHVAAQLAVADLAVVVRVLPRPVAGVMVALGDRAVGGDVRVDERDEAIVCLGFFVDEGEDALRARARHDDGVDLLGELVDVARELLGHVKERDENGDIQRLAGKTHVRQPDEQQHAAHEREGDIEEVADVADDGAEDACVGVGAVAVFKEGVVDLVEFLNGALLVAEDLDDLLTGHRLLNIALGFGDGLLLAQKELGTAAADALGDDYHQNHAEHRNERQPYAEIEHDGKYGQHDRAGLDEGRDGLRHELAQRVDIVGVEAHDIAVLVGVEVADGEVLHAAEHLLTKLVKKALRHIGHELLVDKDRDDREHIE